MILILEQSVSRLKELGKKIDELGVSLNVEELQKSVDDLELQTQAADFWSDPKHSQQVLTKMKGLKDKLDNYVSLKKEFDSVCELNSLANEADDESLVDEILRSIDKLEAEYDTQKISLLLAGEYDANNALISIHPGAGGTEAQDWASML